HVGQRVSHTDHVLGLARIAELGKLLVDEERSQPVHIPPGKGRSRIPYEAEALVELVHHLLLLVHVPSLGASRLESGDPSEHPLVVSLKSGSLLAPPTRLPQARRRVGPGGGPRRRFHDDIGRPVHGSTTSFANPPQLVGARGRSKPCARVRPRIK